MNFVLYYLVRLSQVYLRNFSQRLKIPVISPEAFCYTLVVVTISPGSADICTPAGLPFWLILRLRYAVLILKPLLFLIPGLPYRMSLRHILFPLLELDLRIIKTM